MSAITIDDDLVHFEVLGRGKPVILLHGWLGSWRYWVPAMRQLASKYRTYAIDLWGFGDTARDLRRYTFEAQVALLKEFMDRMGIKKAALVGHDFGAAVATRFATLNPDRVPRMMLVAPPLFWLAPPTLPLTANPAPAVSSAPTPALPGPTPPVFTEAETVPWRSGEMKARLQHTLNREAQMLAGQPPSEAPKPPREAATPPTDQPVREITAASPALTSPAASSAPGTPPSLTPSPLPEMPRLDYVPGPGTLRLQQQNPLREQLKNTDRFKLLEEHVDEGPDRTKLRAEVEKADPLAFAMTIESFAGVDTLRELQALTMPILVLHGKADTFHKHPEPDMVQALTSGRATCAVLSLNEIKHFPMLEEQAGFNRLVMEFLEAVDVRQVRPAELWERRVR